MGFFFPLLRFPQIHSPLPLSPPGEGDPLGGEERLVEERGAAIGASELWNTGGLRPGVVEMAGLLRSI